MKTWIICKYSDFRKIKNPCTCHPIGKAIQQQQEDGAGCVGFLDIASFSGWLEKNGLCAFGEGYKKYWPGVQLEKLPVLY